MKNRKEFEDAIGVAASDYSYATGDDNFECLVKVTCEYGWYSKKRHELLEGCEK